MSSDRKKKEKKHKPSAATRAANAALIREMEGQEQRTTQRDPNEGAKWSQDGQTYTVNSTNDPKAPGGHYISIKDDSTGGHATAVYNSDGTFADTKANRDWRDA